MRTSHFLISAAIVLISVNSSANICDDLMGFGSRVVSVFRSLIPFRSVSEPQSLPQEIEVRIADNPDTHTSLEDLSQARSFAQLAQFPIGEAAKQLVQTIDRENFYSGNPFSIAFDVKPIAAILDRGVTGFERQPYRSPQHMWNDGHDVVLYKISHPDGTMSYMLAYRQSTSPFQLMIGGNDMRPFFNIYFIARTSNEVNALMFIDGELDGSSPIPLSRALSDISLITDASTPMPKGYNFER